MFDISPPTLRYIDLIEDALKHDPRPDFGMDNILSMLADGRAQAYFSGASIAITEGGPPGYLHISICAGDMDEVVNDLLPQIRAAAKAGGYREITGYGRFGWLRALKSFGASPQGVYFTLGLGAE